MKNNNFLVSQDKENVRVLNSINREHAGKFSSLFKNESQKVLSKNSNFNLDNNKRRTVRKLVSEKLNFRMRLNIKQAKLMGKLSAHKLSKENFKYVAAPNF